MRILHTADWHIGRLFHGIHLTEDQAHILDGFVEIVRDTRPDVVVIAGDIYDRAVPPPSAVELLGDVLDRLVREEKVPVLAIAGNHDGGTRLRFLSGMLREQGLHLAGDVRHPVPAPVFADADGPVRFHLIPYADPPLAREALADDSLMDHDAALGALLDRARAGASAGERQVAVAHAFVAGGEETESERKLVVGGSALVEASRFDGFDYVALGHLHRPQTAGRDSARYSGSLYPYSFDEAAHGKSVALVEMDATGACRVECLPLPARRAVRRVEGSLKDILRDARADPARDDYLCVRLADRGAILDPMGQLREVYPNILHVERPLEEVPGGSGLVIGPGARKMSPEELFTAFHAEVTGQDLTEAERAALVEVVEEMDRRDREVDA